MEDIEKHLEQINGSVIEHQVKMVDCNIRFNSIEDIKEDVKKTRECINNFKQEMKPEYDKKIAFLYQEVANLRKTTSSIKWDYKFWTAITGLVVIVTTSIKIIFG